MHLNYIKYTFCFQLRLISSFCSVRILQREKLKQEKEGIYKTVNTDLLRFLQHKNIQVENLHHLAAAMSVVEHTNSTLVCESRWRKPCLKHAERQKHWNVTKTSSQLPRHSVDIQNYEDDTTRIKLLTHTHTHIYIPWCIIRMLNHSSPQKNLNGFCKFLCYTKYLKYILEKQYLMGRRRK